MSSIATKRSALLSDGNARSQSVTVADGQNTFGVRTKLITPVSSRAHIMSRFLTVTPLSSPLPLKPHQARTQHTGNRALGRSASA